MQDPGKGKNLRTASAALTPLLEVASAAQDSSYLETIVSTSDRIAAPDCPNLSLSRWICSRKEPTDMTASSRGKSSGSGKPTSMSIAFYMIRAPEMVQREVKFEKFNVSPILALSTLGERSIADLCLPVGVILIYSCE